jgi:hypothetical protein
MVLTTDASDAFSRVGWKTGSLTGWRDSQSWPIWAVPSWYGEKVESKPLSAEIVREGEERARELRLRLYAVRLEVLDGRNLGRWE